MSTNEKTVSEWKFLDQLGIPEDSELANVELPDIDDTIIIRFGGGFAENLKGSADRRLHKTVVTSVQVFSSSWDKASEQTVQVNFRDQGGWRLQYFKKHDPPGWRMISPTGAYWRAEVEIVRQARSVRRGA